MLLRFIIKICLKNPKTKKTVFETYFEFFKVLQKVRQLLF